MANEFIIRKGYKSLASSEVTGSLTLIGDYESIRALTINSTKGSGTEHYFRTHGVNGDTLAIYSGGNRVLSIDSNSIDVSGSISGSTYYGDGSNLTGISIDGGNATTLDSLDSTQFLRSDTADTAAGAITFSEDITLNVAKLLKSSYNPTSNFLDFDDDSTTHNPDSNVTTLGSVSGIAMATNLNDGGGGNFTVSTGASGTELLRITTAGNATFAGNGGFLGSLEVGDASFIVSSTGGIHTDSTLSVDGNATFAGDVGMVTGHSSGKFAVMSTAVHGSYDFYNNGTSYFNGAVTVDAAFTQTGGAASTFSGNVTVAGTLTAQEFHTEFVSASIIYESGSTKFGDTSDDVHNFTGSVNILSGSATIKGPGAGLTIHNSTNGGGSLIRFTDQSTGTQVGDITFFHSDGSSQGGGASWHFVSEPDTVLVVGSSSVNGRFVAKSAGSTGEVDYGFYDDVNTGMVRTSADNVSLVAGGVRGVGVGATAVSLKYAGDTKLATSNTGISVTGNISPSGVVLFNDGYGINFGNSNAKIYGSSANGIQFNAGGSEAMRFNQSGNLGIGTSNPTERLDVNGDARFRGTIEGDEATTLIKDVITDQTYEGTAFYNPETINAFAGADKWATITLTNAKGSNRTTAVTSLGANPFMVGGNTSQIYFDTSETEIVIEIDHTSEPLKYHGIVGIQFTNTGWRAERVKIEGYNGSSWTTGLDTTTNVHGTVVAKLALGGDGVQKTKITLGNPANSSGGYMRISKIFGYDYKGVSSYDAVKSGTYYLEKFVDNGHYSNIYPAVDSTYNLGTSGLRYANIYADTLHGSVTNATTASYVAGGNVDGAVASATTASNAMLLDGIDSTAFLRSDADDTMSGVLTFSKENASPSITFHNGGNDMGTDAALAEINFTADYQSSPIAYGSIQLKTNTSAVRTDMDFVVKSTSGNQETALKLQGGAGKPKSFFYNDLSLEGNLLLTGTATTTNQGRMIDFTGFDKEGTTDLSDRAYIQHTTNTGGHAGSVLVISSQNDSGDGIAFLTNASSQLKHNSNTIWTSGNDGPTSGLAAQTAATASYVDYSNLAGTVPTWNQDTTGNADTATTASYVAGGNVDGAVASATTATTASYATNADTVDGIEGSEIWRKGTDIPNSANLDDYTTDGYYHQNSNNNATNGTNYPANLAGMLSVQSDGVMIYQTYQVYNSTTDTYRRGYYNGTWYAWKRILMSNDTITATTASNAMLLDGIDSTSFLRSDESDTFTGTLTLNGQLDLSSTDTAANYIHLPRGGGITFYGDTNQHHGIFSRGSNNSTLDSLLISSYKGVHIDLDSNDNNNSSANFTIGRHNSSSVELLKFDGETAHLHIGADDMTPMLDLMFDDHASGASWDTRIQIGKTDDFAAQGVAPTYIATGGYGMQLQANSDGVFFGMEEYTTGHYRPIIQWGDDDTDSPFRIKHETGSELEISYNGDVTTTGDLTVNGGNIAVNSNSGGIQFNDASSYWVRTATNWGIYWNTSSNQLQFHGAGSTKAFIDLDTGRIDTEEHVIANGNFYTNGANGFVFGTSTSEGEYIQRSGNDIRFYAGSSARMTVDGDIGRVGIGTTSPSQKLDVAGSIYLSDLLDQEIIFRNGTLGTGPTIGSNTAAFLKFYNSEGTPTMQIDNGGDVLIGTGPLNPGARLHITGSNNNEPVILIEGSGSTILDIQGSQGQLFSITDDLTGDLFSVSDISGIPILNVNASGDSYFDGNLGIGTTTPNSKLSVHGGHVRIDSSGGTDNYYLEMYEAGAQRFRIYENSNNVYFDGGPGATTFRPRQGGGTNNFQIGGASMMLTTSGQVIGTTGEVVYIYAGGTSGAGLEINEPANEITLKSIDGIYPPSDNASSIGDSARTFASGHFTNFTVDNDLTVGDQIIHAGDTNTYTQFHAADQWRVVTGGGERLEVNNTNTTVANTLMTTGGMRLRSGASDQNSSADTTSIPSTTVAEIMKFEGNSYTDGRYTTELVKLDRGGNLPLYFRQSKGTANSFSNLIRIGDHSYNSEIFQVFGSAKVDSNLDIGGYLRTDEIRAIGGQDLTITCGESFGSLNKSTHNDEFIRLAGENGVRIYASSNNLTSGLNRQTTLIDSSGNASFGQFSSFTTGGTARVTSKTAGTGNSGVALSMGTSNTNMSYVRQNGNGVFQWQTYNSGNSGQLHFQPYGGNVGIGSSSPSAKLDVNGDLKVANGSIGINVTPSTTDGRLDASNDVVAYSTSDKRLKENIIPISDPLNKINKINGVEFDWIPLTDREKRVIHGNEGHDVGVIAQEIEDILPVAVKQREHSKYKAVRYEKIIPLLIEGIKEQQQQIDELKAIVNKLQNEK